MNESDGGSLNMSIERLIDKMEKMNERHAVESDRTESMLMLLGRLSEILVRMEDSKNFEAEMAKKFDLLNKSLERAMNIQEKLVREEGADKTVDKIINGVKIFGMILSTLANSVQFTVDNINVVLNKNTENKADLPGKNQTARAQADLASILQPVSVLVKNLVDERLKQQESSPGSGSAAGEAGERIQKE